VDITGLDIVPGMLKRGQMKAGNTSIRWVQADIRNFVFDEKFDLIFESGGTFQHLLERPDQETMLKGVHQQLAPDGWFVVSAIFPTLDLLASDPEEHDWFTYSDNAGQEIRVSGTQQYDALRQVKTETAVRRWRADDGQEMTRRAPLSLRYWFPQELDSLLHYNSFIIRERYGDYDFSPLTADSPHIIYVCQIASSENLSR
jgi:trans-aconitate methyltransferase